MFYLRPSSTIYLELLVWINIMYLQQSQPFVTDVVLYATFPRHKFSSHQFTSILDLGRQRR